MSILIKGMEMPKTCEDCRLSYTDQYGVTICAARDDCAYSVQCPLVPLPEKHGRLIDAEAFVDYVQNRYDNNEITNGDWIGFRLAMKDQPTIVPAEGGTDNECD